MFGESFTLTERNAAEIVHASGDCMVNGKRTQGRVRNANVSCSLFFVKPARSANAYLTARKLASISKVKEVLITEGEYGFVVRTAGAYGDADAVVKRISKVVGANPKKAVSYCQVRQD